MIQEKDIPVYGNGESRRDYTYIDDIIDGILKAIAYNKTNYEVINLGESHVTTLNRLIKLLEDALHLKARITYLPMQIGDMPRTYANISKARRLLNFQPSTPIEVGIIEFAKWFKRYSAQV